MICVDDVSGNETDSTHQRDVSALIQKLLIRSTHPSPAKVSMICILNIELTVSKDILMLFLNIGHSRVLFEFTYHFSLVHFLTIFNLPC